MGRVTILLLFAFTQTVWGQERSPDQQPQTRQPPNRSSATAAEPVFEDIDVKPGVHINAVGAYTPATREVPGETVARARVIVDHLPACMEEAGDILIPMKDGLIGKDHIRAQLGEVIAGTKRGRESDDEITLFKSVGVAVQDTAAALHAVEKARAMGLGRTVLL